MQGPITNLMDAMAGAGFSAIHDAALVRLGGEGAAHSVHGIGTWQLVKGAVGAFAVRA